MICQGWIGCQLFNVRFVGGRKRSYSQLAHGKSRRLKNLILLLSFSVYFHNTQCSLPHNLASCTVFDPSCPPHPTTSHNICFTLVSTHNYAQFDLAPIQPHVRLILPFLWPWAATFNQFINTIFDSSCLQPTSVQDALFTLPSLPPLCMVHD